MRKIITIMLCLTISLLTFVGCGEDETKPVNQNTSEIPNATIEPTIPTEPEEFYIKTANFSNGFVSISLEGSKGTNKGACIDTSGEIQYFKGEEFTKTVNFTDGTFNYGSKIIDENGDTIFSVDETYNEILAYGGGYYAIAKHISNMTTDKYLICFMDTDGNWCETEWDFSLTSVGSIYMDYLGENIFVYDNYGENIFINLNTNNSFITNLDVIGEFKNGIALVEDNKLLDSNGNLTEINLGIDYANIESGITEGGFWFTSSSKLYGPNHILNFYDINTHSSRTVYSYDENIRITNAKNLYPDNGYLFINLEGVDYKYYFTFINSKGEQLFEPIKCDKIYNYSCDRIVTQLDDTYIIYNGKGEKIFETSRYQLISDYNNDIAIASVYTNRHEFIDKDGNVLFKDGLTYNGDTYKLRAID